MRSSSQILPLRLMKREKEYSALEYQNKLTITETLFLLDNFNKN